MATEKIVEGEYTWRKPAKAIHAAMKRSQRRKEVVTIPTHAGDIVFKVEGTIKNRILTTYYGRTVDGDLLVHVRPEGEFGNSSPYISVST